ncbi:hypothetical protein ACH4N5_20765 [Streptomyces luteogriseus]|uniref:hypothetical protein n=1 Tax=Streptomyces luteogriseus TaxID=68233 RepID=UPI0037A61C37
MDNPVGDDVRSGRANRRLGLFDEAPDMSDATLVLLRIENDGSQGIDRDDHTGPELHSRRPREGPARAPPGRRSRLGRRHRTRHERLPVPGDRVRLHLRQAPADSLASSFLTYLARGNGQDVIRTHGHLPCWTPEGLTLCASGPHAAQLRTHPAPASTQRHPTTQGRAPEVRHTRR